MNFQEGKLLRIFIGEEDRYDGLPLYEWIVRKAKEIQLSGATVLRGMEGFGRHHHMHSAKVLRLSADLPIIIEIVDDAEKIEAFLPWLEDSIAEGLITLETIQVEYVRKES